MIMLPSPLHATLVTLVVYAVAVSAAPPASSAPSLTVETSTQNANAGGSRNLKVTTAISNTGDETLKPLNDPRRVLSPSSKHASTITDFFGSRLPFGGALVNHLSEYTTNPLVNAIRLRS